MAVVDLERVIYQVTEGNAVQVCAIVRNPNVTCPVTFSFDINLSVGEGIVNTDEQAMAGLMAALYIIIAMHIPSMGQFHL